MVCPSVFSSVLLPKHAKNTRKQSNDYKQQNYNSRICVLGESVEENSSVVVKLLIRRPECFGPALRGEGGNGLLAAMKEAIKISETPSLDLPGSVHGISSDA